MNWLTTEILTGFQKLKLLRLANAPSSDGELAGCAHGWCETLVEARPWVMERDRELIRDAFEALGRREPRDLGMPVFWPAPGELLAAMPKDHKAAAPYHQPFEPAPKGFALEWDRNSGNKSTIAKAHAIAATRALGLPEPAWCAPADGEAGTLAQLVASVEAEQARKAEAMRRTNGAQPTEKAA